jgi:hypothetical protein
MCVNVKISVALAASLLQPSLSEMKNWYLLLSNSCEGSLWCRSTKAWVRIRVREASNWIARTLVMIWIVRIVDISNTNTDDLN